MSQSQIKGIVGAACNPPFKSKIICGDIECVLSNHPINHKFDIVIADPPYNIGKDFGNNADNMPLDDYLQWTKRWLAQCFELLADNGIIYVYGFAEILAHVSVMYPIDQQRWLIWHYTNKAVPKSKFWQRSHESILCLWKEGHKRPELEIDQIREPYTDGYMKNVGRVRAGTESRFGGDSGRETIYLAHEGGALPRDVLKVPALAGGAGATERWFMCRDCKGRVYPPSERRKHDGHNILKHPTQKPMDLTRRLLLSRINGNAGRTLIPFAGSGSECLVASQLGVEWRGIEINPEYVSFAEKWITQCID